MKTLATLGLVFVRTGFVAAPHSANDCIPHETHKERLVYIGANDVVLHEVVVLEFVIEAVPERDNPTDFGAEHRFAVRLCLTLRRNAPLVDAVVPKFD